jgi:iron complex outermembrane recepter protein
MNAMKPMKFLALLLLTAAPVAAAELDDLAGGSVDSEIIVTAERERGYRPKDQGVALFGSQSLLDTPFSVSTLSAELIRDQQARTLTEITKNDPSVVATGSGNGFFDTVAIRGFTLGNGGNYFRDGLWFQNQVQTPFENKASVEILKGLSAIRYGFNAPGGVLNYTVKRLELFGNGFGGIGGHLDVGGPVSDTLGIRVNAVVAQDELFVRGIGGPRQMVSAFVSWKAAPNLTLDAEAEYQYLEVEQQSIIALTSFANGLSQAQIRDLLGRFDPQTYLGQRWTTYPTRNFIGSLRATWDFAPGWQLKAAIQKMDLLRNQNAAGIAARSIQANGDYTATLFFSPDQRRDPLSGQLWVEGRFDTAGISHDLVIGTYFVNNRLTFPNGFSGNIGTSNIFAPREIADPRAVSDPSYTGARERQFALYATDYVTVADWLNLFAGVRYTRPIFESFTGPDRPPATRYDQDVVTPSFGFVVKPKETISLYGSYARGLEAGGTAPINTVNANQQLPPLTSEQFELGIKAELAKGALLTFALFDIARDLELIDDQNRFVQDGRQRHRGAELTLAGDITSTLRLVTGAMLLDAKVLRAANTALNGRRPTNVPEFQANAFLDWRLPTPAKLWVNGGIYHTGSRFIDNINSFAVAAQTRFDLGLRSTFAVGETALTARLIVENVTNARLISGASGNFTWGAPRTVKAALSANF